MRRKKILNVIINDYVNISVTPRKCAKRQLFIKVTSTKRYTTVGAICALSCGSVVMKKSNDLKVR